VIYLALLAPDMVEGIARGEPLIDKNIKRLLAAAPLPLDGQNSGKCSALSNIRSRPPSCACASLANA
jgi:hypothetical protein